MSRSTHTLPSVFILSGLVPKRETIGIQTITKPNHSVAFQLMVSMKWKRRELRDKNCNFGIKNFEIFPAVMI